MRSPGRLRILALIAMKLARLFAATLPASLLTGSLLTGSLLVGTGCNFIFNPANSDDIVRCKNTTECEKDEAFFEALNTERLDASCQAPGGSATFGTSKTNQVCSMVDKASVSCGTENLPAIPFADAVEEATTNKGVYAPCPASMKGKLGCTARDDGTCDNGLSNSVHGVCDDKQGQPLYAASDAFLLQDVKDQQCRSYFCSDEFVCDDKSKCIRCDPDKKVGEGGCGDLALNGARSTVYQSNTTLDTACPDASAFDGTEFGPIVVDPNL